MSDQTPQKTSGMTSAKLASDFGERRINLLYPVLLSCELSREAESENVDGADATDEKKPERFYDAVLKPITISEDFNVGLCEFSAGEKSGDVVTLQFDASYYVAFRTNGEKPDDAAFRKLMAQLAKISAWPLFRTLYSQTVSQANEDLPALPAQPKITWQKADEEASK